MTAVPRLKGKVALVTGANTGIGRVTARELAGHGAHVFLACRSEARTQPVIDEIATAYPDAAAEWLPLELGDFESVRRCAQLFHFSRAAFRFICSSTMPGSPASAVTPDRRSSSRSVSTIWGIFC